MNDGFNESGECKNLAAVQPHLLRQSIFSNMTALGFPSCWIPSNIVISFNNILVTGEFRNGAVGEVSSVGQQQDKGG